VFVHLLDYLFEFWQILTFKTLSMQVRVYQILHLLLLLLFSVSDKHNYYEKESKQK